MSQVSDLLALVGLAAVAGAWLKSSRARERAVEEARRQCAEHGLQLLDETVGLSGVRLRRIGGKRQFEWSYVFEVSAHGDDRKVGRLWMREQRLAAISLPAGPDSATAPEPLAHPSLPQDNVIPLRGRPPRTHH